MKTCMLGGYSGKRKGAGITVTPPEEHVKILNTTLRLRSPADEGEKQQQAAGGEVGRRKSNSEKARQEAPGPRRGRHLARFDGDRLKANENKA